MTPPPVPTSERIAERPAWMDETPLPADRYSYGPAEQTNANAFGKEAPRTAWFDPANPNALIAPGAEQGARSPLSTVVTPRGERRGRFLGPLLVALVLVILIGGGAFAFDKARDNKDNRDNADATRSAQLAAPSTPDDATNTPAVTATTGAEETAAPTATTAPTEANVAAGSAPDNSTTAESPPADAEPTERPTEESNSSGSTLRAADYLPTLGDLPSGFQQTAEGRLRKADVAAQLGPDGETTLEEWTWRENASLEFTSNDAAPDETFFLSAGVHRFGRSAGASDGLNGLADVLDSIADPNYKEVDVDKIGDEARAFAAETPDSNIYILYVRNGNIVYRVGGSSLSGDPAADVIALAETLIDQ